MGDIRPINEVIDALGICKNEDINLVCKGCPYPVSEGCIDLLMADAFYYLKMYRSDKAQYEIDREKWETAGKEAKKAWQDAKDKYIAKLKELDIGTLNDPLTWSELKQCEGKPIWIEWYDPIDDKRGWHKAEWYLLQWCRDDEDPEWKMLYAINDEQEQCPYYLKDMGERWTAYRKERI